MRLPLRLQCRPASVPALLLLLLLLVLAGVAGTLEHAAGPLRPRLVDGRDRVGSPGEIAWQAWLLMDSDPPPAGEHDTGAPTVTRRIAPKSVFIAPAFSPQALPACAEGYRADPMGRCVKLVKVDQAAQLNFLLQRLNALYAPTAPPLPPKALTQDAPMQVPLSLSPSQPTDGAHGEPAAAGPEMAPPRPSEEPPKEAPIEPSKEPPKEETASPKPATLQAANGNEENYTPLELGGEAPVQVSVVMAEVDKRSSSEEAINGDGESSNGRSDVPRTVVSVFTIENKTVQQGLARPELPPRTLENQTVQQNSVGEAIAEAPPVPLTEIASSGGSGNDATTTMATGEVVAEVLAPSDVGDSLPMLVISPGPTPPPPVTSPATPPPRAELLNDAHNRSSHEGSGEVVEAVESDVESISGAGAGVVLEEVEGAGVAEETTDSRETEALEDEGEAGSADTPERVEVILSSGGSDEHHFRPPLLLPDEPDDQMTAFSHAPFASGGEGGRDQGDVNGGGREQMPPGRGFIRFPSDDKDQDEPISLFKGDLLKSPPKDNTYRYQEGEADRSPQPENVRQVFWWLPRGWRVEGQQRPIPQHMRDFWSRFPLSSDPSLLAHYGAPSHHPHSHPHAYPAPLPYHQRQAQYDSQWPDMQRDMTSA